MKDMWYTKYRPQKLEDYIFADENQRKLISKFFDEKSFPHLILYGHRGTGKTSLAYLLKNGLGIDDTDFLEFNASKDTSVEIVRNKISSFVSVMASGPFKIVFLDECLDEETEVICFKNGKEQFIKIKDLDQNNDLIKSFNLDKKRIEWKPFLLFDMGESEVNELCLEDGSVILCTDLHKWYVMDGNEIKIVTTNQLHNYNHILSPE